MNKLYYKPMKDEVKVCQGNTCIEARGQNAEILTVAFTFMLVCVGIAILTK